MCGKAWEAGGDACGDAEETGGTRVQNARCEERGEEKAKWQTARRGAGDAPPQPVVARCCNAQIGQIHMGAVRVPLALALLAVLSRAYGSDLARPAAGALVSGRPRLTLEAADTMANAAIREAGVRGFNDIAVFVVDAAGRTIVSKTMLECPDLPHKLAHAKATSCVSTHSSSRALRDKYVPERTPQLLAMTVVGTDACMPLAAVPGGVLCRDASTGSVVGAVGCSGASADEDEHCAIVAAQAVAGLSTEPCASAIS